MKETLSWLSPLHARAWQLQKEPAQHRKSKEEEGRESAQKYRLVFENASDAIFVLRGRQIKFANRSTGKLLGCEMDELLHRSFLDFVFPDDRQILAAYQGGPVGQLHRPQSCSFRVVSKAGEERWAHATIVPVIWQGQPATLHFMRNISRQKRREEQFQKVRHMESIGSLATGFNHLLMGILGNVSLALVDTPPSDPAHERIRNIEKFVGEGIDLTRQLLGLAQGKQCTIHRIDINRIIREQNRLFRQSCSRITLREQLASGLWVTEADRGQMKQLFISLYSSALQSTPCNSRLLVKTGNVTIGIDGDGPHDVRPDHYVRITLSPDGAEPDEAAVREAFEPFHSAPAMGTGTWLGLAVTYGIVRAHGGFINVCDQKGRGTTFSVYLPASSGKAVARHRKPVHPLAAVAGSVSSSPHKRRPACR